MTKIRFEKFDACTDYLFLCITALAITMGSLGTQVIGSIVISLASIFFYLGMKMVRFKTFQIPKTFWSFVLFLLALLVHTIIFKGKFIYFWLFLTGGFYWLLFYNLRSIASKYFMKFLTILGLLLIAFFTFSYLRGNYFMLQQNLFLPVSPNVVHNHLGDLWAVVLIGLICLNFKKNSPWNVAAIALGMAAVAISFSRSAVVALAAGIAYIFYGYRNKKYLLIFMSLAGFMFVAFGIYKGTLGARPYYIEALADAIHSPLGIGMGNFTNAITKTNMVHDLILEVVVGMGIFSAFFIYWLSKTAMFLIKNAGIALYTAILIALSVNFLFDTTYIIPAMVWIWFISLALAITEG